MSYITFLFFDPLKQRLKLKVWIFSRNQLQGQECANITSLYFALFVICFKKLFKYFLPMVTSGNIQNDKLGTFSKSNMQTSFFPLGLFYYFYYLTNN